MVAMNSLTTTTGAEPDRSASLTSLTSLTSRPRSGGIRIAPK
jgi:hypothetical protein